MSEVLPYGLVPVVGVEAVDMLPGVACFAIDRVSVIVREVAYTLDGVRLFFYHLDLVGDIVLGSGGERRRESLTGKHGMRRQRCQLVGHNLKRMCESEG